MKERLTGAIILVALMVLLVPELLTGPIRTDSAPAASPPLARAAPAEAPLRSYTLTLGGAPPAREAAATPAVTAPVQAAESVAPGPPPSSAASPSPGIGKGADAGINEGVNKDLSESTGPPPTPRPAATGSKAGSPRRPQSGRARPSLQAAKSPAHSGVREARSSASSTGWVVQLGSFAGRENAERLARSLAGKGLHMSVSPARAGARVLWRVRAGPVRDRAAAQRLAARLRTLGHRGELLPVR